MSLALTIGHLMHEGVRSSMCEKFGASLETLGQLLVVHRAERTLSGLLFTSLGKA